MQNLGLLEITQFYFSITTFIIFYLPLQNSETNKKKLLFCYSKIIYSNNIDIKIIILAIKIIFSQKKVLNRKIIKKD